MSDIRLLIRISQKEAESFCRLESFDVAASSEYKAIYNKTLGASVRCLKD